MTRVQVEPRSCNQNRRKNDTFTLSATLPTCLHNTDQSLVGIVSEFSASVLFLYVKVLLSCLLRLQYRFTVLSILPKNDIFTISIFCYLRF